jgi:hypothetical protein
MSKGVIVPRAHDANPVVEQHAMIVLTYFVTRMFQTLSTVSSYNTKEWTERISMTLENENGVLVGARMNGLTTGRSSHVTIILS